MALLHNPYLNFLLLALPIASLSACANDVDELDVTGDSLRVSDDCGVGLEHWGIYTLSRGRMYDENGDRLREIRVRHLPGFNVIRVDASVPEEEPFPMVERGFFARLRPTVAGHTARSPLTSRATQSFAFYSGGGSPRTRRVDFSFLGAPVLLKSVEVSLRLNYRPAAYDPQELDVDRIQLLNCPLR